MINKNIVKIIDKILIFGVIVFTIIASIHIIMKKNYVSNSFVLIVGIFIACILVNFIIKVISLKIETWKKRTIIIIYIMELIYLPYCIITKDFHWFTIVVGINVILETFKTQSK